MFDDIKKEPEDMFDATDKVAPQVTSPTDVNAPTRVDASSLEERISTASERRVSFPWKTTLLIVGILVVIVAIFILSMKILGSKTTVTPEPPGEVEEVEQATEAVEVVEEEEPEISRKDTDKDGLTDEEEIEFGTSIRTADTDSDGLFDLEEIKTWETDPLNPDTDGDGYLDGEEVDAGYNPDGDGVLREAPTESS